MASKSGPARVAAVTKALPKPERPASGLSVKVFASVLRDVVLAERKRMHAYIAKSLEGALFFKGVHQDGVEYRPNDLVQARGTLFVCTKTTTAKPGDDGWRLLIKTKVATNE